MLREGFNRLEAIQNRQMTLQVAIEGQDEPVEIDTTIGELFRRDLSQALLLDWHINAPSPVWADDNEWIVPVQQRMADWRWVQTLSTEQSATVSRMSRSQELQLTATLLRARMGNMTNPARRAGKILKYAGSNLVERMLELEGYTRAKDMGQDTFIKKAMTEHMNSNAAEAWSNFTPAQKVLTFEKYSDTIHQN